ncbi:MAG: hypothetical protein C0180_05210 [Aciduliprofundum sp.]|nr:MAG: hypothetical protein C0180_05210 [Aciduliprofundum sp.]
MNICEYKHNLMDVFFITSKPTINDLLHIAEGLPYFQKTTSFNQLAILKLRTEWGIAEMAKEYNQPTYLLLQRFGDFMYLSYYINPPLLAIEPLLALEPEDTEKIKSIYHLFIKIIFE